MPTKTFHLKILDGHSIIEDNGNIILIDTGSPKTLHINEILQFMHSDFPVQNSGHMAMIREIGKHIDLEITTLLGMDILSHYKMIFDYPNRRITFCNGAPLKFGWEMLTLRQKDRIPIISVLVNGKPVLCFFDTGAKLSYLPASATKKLIRTGEATDFYLGFGTFKTLLFEELTTIGTKTTTIRYGTLPPVLENILLNRIEGVTGIIGYDLLNGHKIYLDASLNELGISQSTPGEEQLPDDPEDGALD